MLRVNMWSSHALIQITSVSDVWDTVTLPNSKFSDVLLNRADRSYKARCCPPGPGLLYMAFPIKPIFVHLSAVKFPKLSKIG